VLILGQPVSIPLIVTASNDGTADVELAEPTRVLTVALRVGGRASATLVAAELSCQDTIRVIGAPGSTRSGVVPRGEVIHLQPDDGFYAECSFARGDGQPFAEGLYAAEFSVAAWPVKRWRSQVAELEVRPPQDNAERIHALRAVAMTEVRRENYAAAVPYLEDALEIDPTDTGTSSPLVLAYFSLGRHNNAVKALERVIAARQQRGLEVSRSVYAMLASQHASAGRGEEARRILKGQGYSPEAIEGILANAKAQPVRVR
jgi:hypothetical protein